MDNQHNNKRISQSLHYPGHTPVKDIAQWNGYLKRLSIGEDTYLELRNTPTEALLSKLHPILNEQDKGVSLEYNLADLPNLYSNCDSLIEAYREDVGPQSSVYLARTVQLGTRVENGGVDYDHPDAVYLRRLRSYLLRITRPARIEINIPVSSDTAGPQAGGQWVREILDSIDKDVQDTLEKSSVYISAPTLRELIASGLKAQESLRYAVRVFKNTTLEGKAEEDAGEVLRAAQGKVNTYLEKVERAVTEASVGAKTLILTVRLYPTTGTLILGGAKPITTHLSHNRFIQTKLPEQNLGVMFGNNIALNTLDTQWFQFYSTLFSYIVDAGNPKCRINMLHDSIEDCYVMEPLDFRKSTGPSGGPLQSFNLTFISARTGLNVGNTD